MRTIALWLHILGAGTWLGANVLQGFVAPRMARTRDGALPWFSAVQAASGPLYGSASVVILLTGIYLVVSSEAFTFGSGFVGIGFAGIIVGGALAGLVFSRKTKRVVSLLEEGDHDQARPVAFSIMPWAIVDTLVVAFVILAMVAKWGI